MEFDNQPKWLGSRETSGLSASWTRLIEQWFVGRWEFSPTPSTCTLNRPHPGLDMQLWAPTFNTLTKTKIPKKQDSPFECQSMERGNSLSPKGTKDLRELQGNRFHFCIKNKLSMASCCIAQGAQPGALWQPRAGNGRYQGRWKGGSRGRGHVYTYCWFMLMCGRNQHNIEKGKWKSFSHIQLFAIPWTIQFMEFSRPGHWSG